MYEADNSLLAIVLIFLFYNLFSVLKAEAERITASVRSRSRVYVQQCVTLWLAAEK